MSGLDQILNAILNGDNQTRAAAEQEANNARNGNLGQYIGSLIQFVANERNDVGQRQLAITMLKNSVALKLKDRAKKKELHDGWIRLDASLRKQVKEEILKTLGSPEPQVRFVAAMCVANLARIELPANEWNELFPILTSEAQNLEKVGSVEASLTVIGYICEEATDSADLSECIEHIRGDLLGVICGGMQCQTQSIQKYATSALVNAMEFVHGNMEMQNERDYLMQAICNATQNPSDEVKVYAMQCLVKVATHYYEHLGGYMADIAQITQQALEKKSDFTDDAVKLQALEFWTSVCLIEKDMKDDDQQTQGFSETVMGMLVKLLFQCLLQQDEGQTEDDWNISNAASKCLTNLSEAVGDNIMGECMPFVMSNIDTNNWRQVEAALTVFGCIMTGPDPDVLSQTVSNAYPNCLQMMGHQHADVQDTAIWVVSIICEAFPEVVEMGENLNNLMQCLAPLFTKNPRTACRAAKVIYSLSLHFEELEEEEPSHSNALSPHMDGLVNALITSIDSGEVNLRTESQEALNALIGAAARDKYDLLERLISELVKRITNVGEALNAGNMDRFDGETYMGLLCGCMCVIVRKLEGIISKHHQQIMNVIGAVLGANTPTILSECMGVCGSVASQLRDNYTPYLDGTANAILRCLSNTLEDDTCIAAIGTVGDLANAMKGNLCGEHLEKIMGDFITKLRDKDMSDDIVTAIVGCLGDIALNIGGNNFDRYIEPFMNCIGELADEAKALDFEDDDDEDYALGLFETMCGCFSGILQGYKGGAQGLAKYFPSIVQFAIYACKDLYGRSEDLFKNSITLLGDAANICAQQSEMVQEFRPLVCSDDVSLCLQKAKADFPVPDNLPLNQVPEEDLPFWVFADGELNNLNSL